MIVTDTPNKDEIEMRGKQKQTKAAATSKSIIISLRQ